MGMTRDFVPTWQPSIISPLFKAGWVLVAVITEGITHPIIRNIHQECSSSSSGFKLIHIPCSNLIQSTSLSLGSCWKTEVGKPFGLYYLELYLCNSMVFTSPLVHRFCSRAGITGVTTVIPDTRAPILSDPGSQTLDLPVEKSALYQWAILTTNEFQVSLKIQKT